MLGKTFLSGQVKVLVELILFTVLPFVVEALTVFSELATKLMSFES